MSRAEYQRQWYLANREAHVARVSERNKKHKDMLREYVRSIKQCPCLDCGIQYPYYAMEFDHLRDKECNISVAVTHGWSLRRLQTEIDKCEIVCANCHAIRTHLRLLGVTGSVQV